MSKRDVIAEVLDGVARLRAEPDAAAAREQLRGHLTHRSGLVVAKAAQVIRERKIDSLGAELAMAFERFIVNGAKVDPGCAAKLQVVLAGLELNCLEAPTYLHAIRHVQMEGSFGPPVDTAAPLRGNAAMGLLNVRYPQAFHEIAELLNERNADGTLPDARRAAIRALGTVVSETSAVMLRMTARRFESDADTLAECFTSLNAIDAPRSFDFIASFLEKPGAADVAALAVAESRQPQACATLLKAWNERMGAEDAQAFFTALSMTRRPEAIDFLVERIGSGSVAEAGAAVDALRLHRADDALRDRVTKLVAGRRERGLKVDWS